MQSRAFKLHQGILPISYNGRNGYPNLPWHLQIKLLSNYARKVIIFWRHMLRDFISQEVSLMPQRLVGTPIY